MAYKTAIAQTFLRNAIVRLNKEEGSEIDMDMLDLVVDFTLDTKPDSTSYVNVYLQSKQAAKWPVPGLGIDLVLEKGEKLYLHEGDGYSYKHTLEQLKNIIQKAGLRLEKYWTDEQQNAIFCQCSTDNVN
ncbi:uncharacterized protein LOC132564288 [Ylistrum balloti]|uniref:uncharacterized protein LOC132564288 n=1 Tax=Ylistrum balloti TaxID=509963 RepID=UPI002905E3A1|nr:uncharacterized protein LOC132564288 [Ylistrum balloti]